MAFGDCDLRFKRADGTEFTVTTSPSNRAELIRLYEKKGFKFLGEAGHVDVKPVDLADVANRAAKEAEAASKKR